MKKQMLLLGLFGLFFICSCGNKSESGVDTIKNSEEVINLTKNNYSDYVNIYTVVNQPTREDGTVVNSSDSKVYSDTKINYFVRCEPKENVKVNRIDVNVEVKMYISYIKLNSSLYTNEWVNENITCECNDIVFSEYVTSYSYVYKKEKLKSATGMGYNLSYISGSVTVSK